MGQVGQVFQEEWCLFQRANSYRSSDKISIIIWSATLPHPLLENYSFKRCIKHILQTNEQRKSALLNMSIIRSIIEQNYRQYNKCNLHHQLFNHNIAEKLVIKLSLMKKDGSQGKRKKKKNTGKWKHSCTWTIKNPQRKNQPQKPTKWLRGSFWGWGREKR